MRSLVLMQILTGAESTLVVNNNAAAVLLTLAGLCAGKDVVVSRGESVEIGGGFRVPEVIAKSGCHLVEVGTTNRTYPADFEDAMNAQTGALLKVHASNFSMHGFTTSVSTGDMARVAYEHDTILIEDLAAARCSTRSKYGLRHEPTVGEALASGASIVTLSGDKLLGGPQAGLIAGNVELVARIERHPLARAVRADKVTLAGISTTLRHYLAGNAESDIPVWRAIATSAEELVLHRAHAIADSLGLSIEPTRASVGGGSLPGETMPSFAIAITVKNADDQARKLRTGTPVFFQSYGMDEC